MIKSYEFKSEIPTYHFDEPSLNNGGIDDANGVIRGVSIITSGVTAKGHDLQVDNVTLTQMFSCAKAMGTVPVKWNHQSGADAVNGYLTNFRIEGNQLRGDWHLLKTHEKYGQALELATRMPKGVGLSASFQGESENVGGKKCARCNNLVSVDLVSNPAANPNGMFSVDSAENGMNGNPDPNQEPSLGDILQAVQQQGEQIAQLGQQVEQQNESIAEIESFNEELTGYLNDEGSEHDEQEHDDPYGQEEQYQDAPGGDLVGAKAGGEGGGEFAELKRAVIELQQREQAAIEFQAQQEQEHNFNVLNEKILKLAEINKELQAKCDAYEVALQTAGSTGVSFNENSTGGMQRMEAGESRFEEAVRNFEAGGDPKTIAINKAMELENGALFREHQSNKRMF